MTKKSTYNILAIVQGDPNVNAGARLRIYNWANDLHNYRKDIRVTLIVKPKKPDETETAESTQDPEKLEEDIRKEDQSEKKLQPDPVEVALPEPKDPYEIARDEYNAFLASQLLDITYSLQVFRIGMHVVIQLEIDEEGFLLSQKVIQSSGSKDFDETAMIGVEELELKPLPEPLNDYASYKVNLRIQNYQ